MQHLTNDALHAKAYRIIGEALLANAPWPHRAPNSGSSQDILQALADAGLHLIEDQPLDVDQLMVDLQLATERADRAVELLGAVLTALHTVRGALVVASAAGTAQSGSEPAPNAGEPGAVPSRARAPFEVLAHCAWGCSYRCSTSSPEATHELMERHYRVDHGEDTR